MVLIRNIVPLVALRLNILDFGVHVVVLNSEVGLGTLSQ